MRRMIGRLVGLGCVLTGMLLVATAGGEVTAGGATTVGATTVGETTARETALGAIRVAEDECNWRLVETIRACAAPAAVCPNGFCQSYQECSQSEFRFACPALPSSIVYPGGTMCRELLDCGSVLPMMPKLSCQCAKGLFGCCANDCTPSGTSNGEFVCAGQIVTLSSPQE